MDIRSVPRMRQDIVVIDNFLDKPDKVRQSILDAGEELFVNTGHYSGRRTNLVDDGYRKMIDSKIEEVLPFKIKIHAYFENSKLTLVKDDDHVSAAEFGIGKSLSVRSLPVVKTDDQKDNPVCIVSFIDGDMESSTMLFALDINGTQPYIFNNKTYYIQIRPIRYYFPFRMKLKTFTQDLYPGSNIPKHYSSLVELTDFTTNKKRDVLIYMNHPLRRNNYTFFQASFGQDKPSSVLQVVYNQGWFLPYISSLIIAFGLAFHFIVRILRSKRRL